MKKTIKVITENSEAIKVNSRDMSLTEIAEALAGLKPAYRKEVIRTAKKLAKAYKSYQDIQAELGNIEEIDNGRH